MAKHKDGVIVLSTTDIVRAWFSKRKRFENKQVLLNNQVPPEPFGEKILTIAIVLDEEVQEIIRAQSNLASLFLSSPSFVEIDPTWNEEDKPGIGWKHVGGRFFNPNVLVREGEESWAYPTHDCGECDACLANEAETLGSEVKQND
jgi:hypothetical protein